MNTRRKSKPQNAAAAEPLKSPPASSPGRARNMRAIKRTDTKPEIKLRRALHAQGLRYRKDFRIDLAEIKVRPDIVFTARKIAVFVDGCFWHSCPDHSSIPVTNTDYWEPKLRRTIERDETVTIALRSAGWHVLRFWEHEPLGTAVAAVARAVNRGSVKHEFDSTKSYRHGSPDMPVQ